MSKKSLLLAALAGGSLTALAAGAAFADPLPARHEAAPPPASAADLDALKAEVEALKARVDDQANTNARQAQELQQTQSQLTAAQAQLSAARAAADQAVATVRADQQQVQTIPAQVNTAVAAAKPKDDGTIHYRGVTITLGGFSELAGVYRSRDETADISSSFSKIPFANDPASHTAEGRLTARQSRYSALIQGDVTPVVHLGFYGEFDFQGGAQTANSNQSDSYNPRIRNLYGEVNWDTFGLHLLAGQNWSLVTLNSKGITPRNEVPPPVIDAQYVPGFDWARQPQIRLTKDFDKKLWIAVSAENAQTTLGPLKTAGGISVVDNQVPTNGYYNGTAYSLNRYPDLVGKVAYEGALGDHSLHLEALGLLRSFYDHTIVANGNALGITPGSYNQSTSGGGWGGGVTFGLLPKLVDLQGSFLTGKGVGRYGAAGLPDVTFDADGKMEGIQETMWLAGATIHATKALDIYAFGGQEMASNTTTVANGATYGYGGRLVGSNNAGCLVENGACSPVNKAFNQYAIGFWDKAYQGSFGSFRVGVQYSHTDRQVFADVNGLAPKASENMIFTSIRYYPF